jgi:hypothetical protein
VIRLSVRIVATSRVAYHFHQVLTKSGNWNSRQTISAERDDPAEWRTLTLRLPTVDIMTALEALDPEGEWRKRSVDVHLYRLRERGIVPRRMKARGMVPAIYIRVGVEVDPLPFEDITLAEVVAQILADGVPIRQTKRIVVILDQAYKATMTPKALRDAVGVVLRNGNGRIRQRGREWQMVSR